MATNEERRACGRRIAKARARAGLTQRELADRVGTYDGMQVSRWERGDVSPSAQYLVALAQHLGVTEAWLLTGRGEGPASVPAAPDAGEERRACGRRIAEARARAGLTQRELADRVGTYGGIQVSRWERGDVSPSAQYLVALAQHLGVTEAWLLTGRGEERGVPLAPDAGEVRP